MLLSALAGLHKLVIFAGENSHLTIPRRLDTGAELSGADLTRFAQFPFETDNESDNLKTPSNSGEKCFYLNFVKGSKFNR